MPTNVFPNKSKNGTTNMKRERRKGREGVAADFMP
jgi:hypothetical protein